MYTDILFDTFHKHSYLTMLPLFSTSVQELPQNAECQIQQLNQNSLYILDLNEISTGKIAKSNTCMGMTDSKFLLIFCTIYTFLNFCQFSPAMTSLTMLNISSQFLMFRQDFVKLLCLSWLVTQPNSRYISSVYALFQLCVSIFLLF